MGRAGERGMTDMTPGGLALSARSRIKFGGAKMTDESPAPNSNGDMDAPRWVKVFLLVLALLLLLGIVLLPTGGHAPGIHTP